MLASRYDLIVFDLDGTLIDSERDITESANRALARLGRPPLDHDRIRRYVGHGARRLMERTLGEGASESEVDRALAAFLEDYRAHSTESTRVYPGVREGLELLRSRTLAVLTNKPLDLARKILAELDLIAYFAELAGGDSFLHEDGTPCRKPDPRGLIELAGRRRASLDRTLMVGDTAVDVMTARNAGTACAGVTYGFRPEEFADFPPDFLLDSIEELAAPKADAS